MIIERLHLQNWMRFRGEHTLQLQPGVYGIVATYEDDPRRSNWAGKTAVLEAIRFALYGQHRHPREDDWITNGEAEGCVRVELPQGVIVERSRKRGSPTRLRVVHAGGEATGSTAQLVLDSMTGLNGGTFDETCWFGQKGFSRFLLETPAARMERVEQWLRLDRLKLALETAKGAFRSRLVEEAAARAAVEKYAGDQAATPEAAAVELEQATQGLALASGNLDRALDLHRTAAAVEAARRLQADHDSVVASGKVLAGQVKRLEDQLATPDDTRSQADALKVQLADVERATNVRLKIVNQGFDGHCPVTAATCPAVAHVEATVAEARGAVEEGRSRTRELRENLQALQLQVEAREDLRVQLEASKLQLDGLRRRVVQLRSEMRDVPPMPAELPDLGAICLQVEQAARRVEAATAAKVKADMIATRGVEAAQHLQQVVGRRADAAVALEVFRVSMRKIAEAALAEIEADANAMLAGAGIQLTVQVLWSHTGQGHASHCTDCGLPFPASAKVKACTTCGAARGAKMVERLDLQLSDRSGAAEDLAGAALQLAAWDWIRRDRGIRWGVAFLDEPFGALDATNRQSFATALRAMLQARFQQAFVVAHHDDVLDALPNRLVIRATEYGSSLEES